jgi:hypothetical protein
MRRVLMVERVLQLWHPSGAGVGSGHARGVAELEGKGEAPQNVCDWRCGWAGRLFTFSLCALEQTRRLRVFHGHAFITVRTKSGSQCAVTGRSLHKALGKSRALQCKCAFACCRSRKSHAARRYGASLDMMQIAA